MAHEYTTHDRAATVFGFFSREAERLGRLGRTRASESCRTTLNALMRFRHDADFTFDMMDSELMESFEAYLKGRGVVRNTVSYYIRCVRSVYNRAVERGLASDCKPFRHVCTGNEKTVKRALGLDDIRAIKALDLASAPNLDYARDMFMFSFYMRGMPFVDMAYLRKSDLNSGTVCYCRKKTGQRLCVEWMPCMQAIVAKYPPNVTPYMLPIITDINADERRQYLCRMRTVNRNLKKVAMLAGISVPLSGYYARHSWASLAHNMNVPLSVISEALGHDNELTTQIYLNSIAPSAVNSANRRILGLL